MRGNTPSLFILVTAFPKNTRPYVSSTILSAILGTVSTRVAFRVSGSDAERLQAEFKLNDALEPA